MSEGTWSQGMGTTQSVRSWLHKSNPENSHEGVAAQVVIPVMGKRRQKAPLGSLAGQYSVIHEIQAKETPCLREMDGIPGDASPGYHPPSLHLPLPLIKANIQHWHMNKQIQWMKTNSKLERKPPNAQVWNMRERNPWERMCCFAQCLIYWENYNQIIA